MRNIYELEYSVYIRLFVFSFIVSSQHPVFQSYLGQLLSFPSFSSFVIQLYSFVTVGSPSPLPTAFWLNFLKFAYSKIYPMVHSYILWGFDKCIWWTSTIQDSSITLKHPSRCPIKVKSPSFTPNPWQPLTYFSSIWLFLF